jgi:hypothetical protein
LGEGPTKLAEALALRAETTRRIQQLRGRIVDNARYQEREKPAEDAAGLLAETCDACAELESVDPADQPNQRFCATGRRDHHGRDRVAGHA